MKILHISITLIITATSVDNNNSMATARLRLINSVVLTGLLLLNINFA